jgi:hypothetical protein
VAGWRRGAMIVRRADEEESIFFYVLWQQATVVDVDVDVVVVKTKSCY